MRSVLLCVGHVIGYVKTFVQLFGFFTPDGIVSCPFFLARYFSVQLMHTAALNVFVFAAF